MIVIIDKRRPPVVVGNIERVTFKMVLALRAKTERAAKAITGTSGMALLMVWKCHNCDLRHILNVLN